MRNSLTVFCLLAGILVVFPTRTTIADEGGLVEHSLVVSGVTRSYYVHVPVAVSQAGGHVPLVILLHGGGSNGKSIAVKTGFTAKADRENFIVAYPNGTSGGLGYNTWNARHCCAYAMKHNMDDVGFIRAMIDQIVSEYPVDPRRVYVTGASNGGMMTHQIGIALSDKVAAIAPVIGALFGDEARPAMPVPALFINGALDTNVVPEGGRTVARSSASDGVPVKSAAYQGQFWAAVNGCNPQPQEQRPTSNWPITVWTYTCPRGQEVVRMLVMDNGHAWPGGLPGERRGADIPSKAMNATDVIWDFFKTHSR